MTTNICVTKVPSELYASNKIRRRKNSSFGCFFVPLHPCPQVSLGTCCELCVSCGILHPSPYVTIQCTATVQSSGDNRSVCVPQARGLDLLWRTHTTLKGSPREYTHKYGHMHTGADFSAHTQFGQIQASKLRCIKLTHIRTDTHRLWLHRWMVMYI